MKIYIAQWNQCYHESDYSVLSCHKTKQSAEKAVEEHKIVRKEYHAEDGDTVPEYELWRVLEQELLD